MLTRILEPRCSGVCVWLTGLSGAGKTTTAVALSQSLLKLGCAVAVFDGDRIRSSVTQNLTFSKSDRLTNVVLVAAMAKDVVNKGEIAICALISPYQAMRKRARQIIGSERFIEVFVDTPIAVCEARDPKGLYKKARQGTIREFTGIDAEYERPLAPDVVLDTVHSTVNRNVNLLTNLLTARRVR